jgi:hypothetical protein
MYKCDLKTNNQNKLDPHNASNSCYAYHNQFNVNEAFKKEKLKEDSKWRKEFQEKLIKQ